jgi:tetratricopeptide (TPR) repeat protein
MFSNKIILLVICTVLPLSSQVLASEALSKTQGVIGRVEEDMPVTPQPGKELRLVEDWADLYQGESNVQPDQPNSGVPSVSSERIADHTIPLENNSSFQANNQTRRGSTEKYAAAAGTGLIRGEPDAAPVPEVVDESVGRGGSLLINRKPSQQELIDRAAYWDSRGRSDLANNIRKQLTLTEPKQFESPDNAASSGRNSANFTSAVKPAAAVTPVRPEAIVSLPAAVVDRVITAQPGAGGDAPSGAPDRTQAVATPSRQELNERAQYWEARGRSDLAEQIRQKLQVLEAAPVPDGVVRQARKTAGASDATRSALEDSLLRNPDSLKSRLDLGQIYRSTGEISRARAQIDSVLSVNPDLPEAIFASAQVYSDQHLWWETLHTLEKISPASRTGEMARLQKTAWAHVQIDRADALVRQGNNADAEVLLRRVAVELAVNYNQEIQPEPPELWKNEPRGRRKAKP